MQRLIIFAMAVLLAGCATGYRRVPLGLAGGGYSDKQVGEGRWEVRYGGNGYTARGYAGQAAIYRSAELAHAAGFPYFQVVKSRGVVHTMTMGHAPPTSGRYIGENVFLTVQGVQSDSTELKCENENGTGCMTLSTEKVLRDLEPVVRRRPSNAQAAQASQPSQTPP